MKIRAHAIVIGIDEYTHNPDWNLTGAVRDAKAFADWAVGEGGVDPANLTLLLSPAPDPKQLATREAIRAVFRNYRKGAGKEADRLWFYYAGHGVAPPGHDTAAGPIVVPADVEDLDDYVNDEPIGLEIFRGAMQNVRPKEQFFFVDACRNAIPMKDNKILSQQLLWDIRGIDDESLSTQAVFLGTTAGQKAKEVRGHGLFGRALIAALRGLGPKLSPPAAPPAVNERLLFDDLVEFVRDAVRRGLDELPDLGPEDRKGVPYASLNRVKGDLAVAEFAAGVLPKAKVSAIVDPEDARGSGRIEFLEWAGGAWVTRARNPEPVPPPLPEEAVFELSGGKHYVKITAKDFEDEVRDILVYEDKRFPFELRPRAVPALADDDGLEALGFENVVLRSAPARTGGLFVTCPDEKARVAIYDGGGRELARAYGQVQALELVPGPYKVTAELTAAERAERMVVVRAGDMQTVTLDVAAPRGPRIEALLRDHDIELEGHYAKILDGLGHVANIRLGSLLTYAAWSVRWPNNLQTLHGVGVDPLKKLKGTDSALQVLIGDMSENAVAEGCRVQIEGDAKPLKLKALPKLPAVQASSSREPGSMRVRVEMPGFAPVSFAVTLLPGFITALIITREADGDIDVQQHLNPIDVNRPVGPGFGPPRVDDVRLVELAWRALESRDPLDDVEFGGLMQGKRSNPMLAVIAGYRMFRTDRAAQFRDRALKNMLRLFPGLPDVHVLAGLYEPEKRDEHFQRAMDAGTPVLAEGLWALVEWLAERSIAAGRPAPALQENVMPGIAWTAFTERPRAARVADVRVVGTSGRSYVGDAADYGVLTKAAQSVGLLEEVDGIAKSSTFLIAPTLVVCPVYVVRAFARENADGTWTMTRQNVRVRLECGGHASAFVSAREYKSGGAASALQIRRVLRTLRPAEAQPDGGPVDRALLETCWPVLLELDAAAAAPPLKLGQEPAAGQRVAILGFPFDYQIPSETFAQQFAGASGEKHAMPGAVVRPPGKTWTLDYDCFTAAGTSGAPVVSTRDGTVVGMHVIGMKTEEGFKRGTAIAVTRFADLLV